MKTIVLNADVVRLFAVFGLIALSGWGPLLVTETVAETSTRPPSFAHLRYDAGTQVLALTFPDGSCYEYRQVPFEVVQDLRRVANPAEYFARSIRSRYAFTRLNKTLLSSASPLAARF